jgi:hypothetical protein
MLPLPPAQGVSPRTKLAIIESPYSGDIERNTLYARRAMRDAIERGFAPFASHLLYTQPGVLDENEKAERELGINLGLVWAGKADIALFYLDYGTSSGMQAALDLYNDVGLTYSFCYIGVNPA